jgi:short-subunit dehydrogenase
MKFKNETIWIIGASSGMGRELAIGLSKAGANLILSARNQEALVELNNTLGGNNQIFPLDIADSEATKMTISKAFAQNKIIDRIIFMAALYDPKSIKEIKKDFVQQLMQVNLIAPINLAIDVMPYLEKQTKSQIVFCCSVAGYTGLPIGQPYSSSKAGLINFVESLYAESPENVDIKIINPGFVKTPMTDMNRFKMPMIMSSQDAANKIIAGLNSSRFEIYFPTLFVLIMKFLRILPYKIKLFLIQKILK